MSINTLPVFEYAELNIAPLPMHLMSVETHECVYCGEAPIWDTYAEYANDFWESWEGDRYHVPDEEDEFYIFASACNATA